MEIVPEPAAAFALKVVLAPLQIGLAAKAGAAVGKAFKVKDGDVAVTVQPLLFVTVTLYVPLADTEPLALFPLIPDDQA